MGRPAARCIWGNGLVVAGRLIEGNQRTYRSRSVATDVGIYWTRVGLIELIGVVEGVHLSEVLCRHLLGYRQAECGCHGLRELPLDPFNCLLELVELLLDLV